MNSSPIPRFDNHKLDMNPALQLFGAGRAKRVYTISPYTKVKSLAFEDHPFSVETWEQLCEFCGAIDSYLALALIDD